LKLGRDSGILGSGGCGISASQVFAEFMRPDGTDDPHDRGFVAADQPTQPKPVQFRNRDTNDNPCSVIGLRMIVLALALCRSVSRPSDDSMPMCPASPRSTGSESGAFVGAVGIG